MHGADVELAFKRISQTRTFHLKSLCPQSGRDFRDLRVIRGFSVSEPVILIGCDRRDGELYFNFLCTSRHIMLFAEVGLCELHDKMDDADKLISFLKQMAEEERAAEYEYLRMNDFENSWS